MPSRSIAVRLLRICGLSAIHGVGCFLKHLPAESREVETGELIYDGVARLLAFKRANGKMSVAVSNRTATDRRFQISIACGVTKGKGFRHTPEEMGEDTLGVAVGVTSDASLARVVPRLSWELGAQQ